MDVGKTKGSFSSLALFIITILLVLAARYHSLDFVQRSLWAEDGNIFYNGANLLGLRSLFEPYAGYLHVYPRLIALISSPLNLSAIPYAYFFGWIMAFVLMRWAISVAFSESQHANKLAFFVPALLLFMPHSGETFLSLTNTQWWIAISLAIMASTPEKFGKGSIPILVLMTLTGPFCILFAPVCAIRSIQTKRYWVLVPIILGAAIQAYFLTESPRPSQALDPDIDHWLVFLNNIVLFGGGNTLTLIASVAFWVSTMIIVLKSEYRYKAIIACAAIALAASVYSMKGIIGILSPYGDGSRYFVIPFALLAVATFSCEAYGRTLLIACMSLSVIFFNSNRLQPQVDMNFTTYVELSKYEATLIPLAPRSPAPPGFYLKAESGITRPSQYSDYQVVDSVAKLEINACNNSGAVGLLGTVELLRSGNVTLSIKENGSIIEETRNYPAGVQRIQLATKKSLGPADLEIKSERGVLASGPIRAKLICM